MVPTAGEPHAIHRYDSAREGNAIFRVRLLLLALLLGAGVVMSLSGTVAEPDVVVASEQVQLDEAEDEPVIAEVAARGRVGAAAAEAAVEPDLGPRTRYELGGGPAPPVAAEPEPTPVDLAELSLLRI